MVEKLLCWQNRVDFVEFDPDRLYSVYLATTNSQQTIPEQHHPFFSSPQASGNMSSGLTRRRGAGGGGTANDDENGIGQSNSSNNVRDSALETSYENIENGHKIAFDPRDMSESVERSKQPKLTMMEEVVLLGLKDKQVR
jgi:hypothetical protein